MWGGAGMWGLSEMTWCCCLSSECVPQACEPYLLISKAFPGSVSVPTPLPFCCGLDPGNPCFCSGCSPGCQTSARDACSHVNMHSGVWSCMFVCMCIHTYIYNVQYCAYMWACIIHLHLNVEHCICASKLHMHRGCRHVYMSVHVCICLEVCIQAYNMCIFCVCRGVACIYIDTCVLHIDMFV